MVMIGEFFLCYDEICIDKIMLVIIVVYFMFFKNIEGFFWYFGEGYDIVFYGMEFVGCCSWVIFC